MDLDSIDSLEQWESIAAKLSAENYHIWQAQYSPDSPEGFRVRFISEGKPDVEIVTHSEAVYEAIVRYEIGR